MPRTTLSFAFRAVRRLAALVLGAACGSAADPTYAPPLYTLNGTIVASAIATPDHVRVALVWQRGAVGGAAFLVSVQELDVRAEFPATFHLDVREPPPSDVMNPTNATAPGAPTAFAIGALLVYEDTNGNGRLDTVARDALASPDRILGAPARLQIIYLEGGGIPNNPSVPTDEDFVAHTPGFNLILEPERAGLEPGCTASTCQWSPVGPWTRVADGANLTIVLDEQPRLARALCEQGASEGASGNGRCEPCFGSDCDACPIAPGSKITCSPDRSAFVTLSCTSKSLCALDDCTVISGRRGTSVPAPASWPCP